MSRYEEERHGSITHWTDGTCVIVDPSEGWEDWELQRHVKQESGYDVDFSAPLAKVSWLPDGWLRYGVK